MLQLSYDIINIIVELYTMLYILVYYTVYSCILHVYFCILSLYPRKCGLCCKLAKCIMLFL